MMFGIVDIKPAMTQYCVPSRVVIEQHEHSEKYLVLVVLGAASRVAEMNLLGFSFSKSLHFVNRPLE